MSRKWLMVLLLVCLLGLGSVVRADGDESTEDPEKKEDAEEATDAGEKSADEESDESDESEPDDDGELPKTITINGREVAIERADRTITSKITFEITFGTEVIGNITFGLFGRNCPKTVRNFVTLANPNRPTGEGYKGSKIHRIVKGFAFQGGDYLNNDGSGGWSIYGRYFRDENFSIKHFPFCLSMANSGPNTNASQFFVPVIRTSWLDGKHVVFGQVLHGHKIAKQINDIKTNAFDRPYRQVYISNTWTEMYKKDYLKKTEL